ncbi:hypothetical protein SEA_MALACHAI_71 [Gordonia phage Malachai]|nr:hypothetical protein SEA_BEGONIA_71 [Gordonia phage Begonia]UVF60501.1 hypothetical protein SEA_MALACHAI_71 [Gordonia phage Malachai]
MRTEKRSKVVAVDTSDSADSPIEWRIHVMRHPDGFGRLPAGSPSAEDVPTDALRALLAFAITGLALSGVDEAVEIVRDELARHQPDEAPDVPSSSPGYLQCSCIEDKKVDNFCAIHGNPTMPGGDCK